MIGMSLQLAYSLFTLRRVRSPWIHNGEQALFKVNRLYVLLLLCTACTLNVDSHGKVESSIHVSYISPFISKMDMQTLHRLSGTGWL